MPSNPEIERLPTDDSTNSLPNFMRILRKNFESLTRYFASNGQLNGFAFLEFELKSTDTNLSIKHGLGFVPKDVLLTRLLAPSGAKLIFNHASFTTDSIVVSGTGWTGDVTMKVRMFVGTYQGKSPGADSFDPSASLQEVKAIL